MFKVGDVVKVKSKILCDFGSGPLIVSKVESFIEQEYDVAGEPEQWISIEGFPQDGSHTYMSRVFELVERTSLENK